MKIMNNNNKKKQKQNQYRKDQRGDLSYSKRVRAK